ncbi:MAG TPA: MFS transporter [Rhizomicrobium sp.]|jgi:MFS family permease|nr:MFS transporter [Rhizomicrobium sp.]
MRFPLPSGALWRHPGFLRLWSAQTVSAFGARITREGLALASVLTIDAKPYQLGILAAFFIGPSVLVGLTAGGFVDRARKRGIMIASDLARAAILFSVPLAAWLHLLAMNQLYFVALAMGALSVLFDIADHAYLPHLIAREHLLEGNTKLSTTDSLAEIGGPALAGVLVQTLTAPIAIAVNAATYVVSALFLGRIREREELAPASTQRLTMLADLKAGFAAFWDNPVLWPLPIMAALSALFGGIFSALYVIFFIRTLGLTPLLMGITVAVGGVGSLLGTAMSAPLVRLLGVGRAIVLGFLISAVSTLFIPLAAGPLWLKLASLMLAQIVGDSFAVAAMIPTASLRQAVIPRDLLGRAAAALTVASGAPAVLGAVAGGILGSILGPRIGLFVAVAGILAAPLFAATTPLWRLAQIPDDPLKSTEREPN